MNELVQALSKPLPIQCKRPEKSSQALKECIERNYVHVHFTETGTELSMNLFKEECSIDLQANGMIRLVGGLILNYEKIKCIADVNLETCEGVGHVMLVDSEEYRRITHG